jgi:2-polyprenyl-6-methoxyphenol hydroxylase-like FAD-dependent oxidoreductase
VKSEGLEAFRKRVVEMSSFLADRVGELKSWDDVKLLSVTVDRLPRWWRPGLICIGDAAHAMSPIGGVGINMAVQADCLAFQGCGSHTADGKDATLPLLSN